MDNTEIAVKLEAHEHEIEALRHRTKDVEQLTISMNKRVNVYRCWRKCRLRR